MIPQAVVFDLDGTLLDSEPLHKRAEVETFARFGISITEEELHAFTGRILPELLREVGALKGRELSVPEFLEVEVPILGEWIDREMRMFADAERLVRRLSQRGVPLALCTSSMKWYVDRAAARFPLLREAFPLWITMDDVTYGKPDPEPYALACTGLGIDPASAAAVEDSVNGLMSAQKAGLMTVGIDRYAHGHLERADLVVPNLDYVWDEIGL